MIATHLNHLLLILIATLTTPSPAEWTRKMLIGYNDVEIVYLEIKRSSPGSYYRYTDSVFTVSRNPLNESDVRKQLLRATLHEDSTSEGDWKQKELHTELMDINEYLSGKKLHYTFASSRPWIGTLKFEDYGLLLQYKDIGRLLLPREQIAIQSREFLDIMEYEKPRIVAKYDSKNYLLLIVEIGQNNMDSEFKQFILAIPLTDLSSAEQTFRELDR